MANKLEPGGLSVTKFHFIIHTSLPQFLRKTGPYPEPCENIFSHFPTVNCLTVSATILLVTVCGTIAGATLKCSMNNDWSIMIDPSCYPTRILKIILWSTNCTDELVIGRNKCFYYRSSKYGGQTAIAYIRRKNVSYFLIYYFGA